MWNKLINFMPWTSSFILCTCHESRYIHHSSNCHNMYGHIFREYIHKHMTFIFQFSARVSGNTNIINGLNTIHGYQSCVRYMTYDVWRKIYLWEYELASLFPIKPMPLMWVLENWTDLWVTVWEVYWVIFYGNTSPVNWLIIQKLANLRLGLCVRWNFFTSTMGRIDSGRIVL